MRSIALVAAAAVALSGCLSTKIAKMTPEQQIGLINAAAAAGCSGNLTLRAGAGTAAGVSPGYASGEFVFNGGCDPTKARPLAIVPLSELGKSPAGTEPIT